jgi:hypothetical protein
MGDFLDGQLQVQLVDIVERHLMAISAEDYKLVSDYHRTVTVTRTRLLPYHNVGVVLQRLQELRDSLLPKLCQLVLLRLNSRVWSSNHV